MTSSATLRALSLFPLLLLAAVACASRATPPDSALAPEWQDQRNAPAPPAYPRLADLLAAAAPGLRVDQDSYGNVRGLQFSRSMLPDAMDATPVVVVDGAVIEPEAVATVLEALPVDAHTRVEVKRSASIAAYYSTRRAPGVVLIRTR